MVPLRYTEGGVLARPGHTESAVGESKLRSHDHVLACFLITYTEGNAGDFVSDLCKLTSLPPVGLLCEIVKPDDADGEMARRDDCKAFAEKWGLKMISVEMIKEEMKRRNGGVNGTA